MALVAKILVIEDDPIVVAALEVFLKSHQVDYYKSLPIFLKDLNNKKSYDLVLLDLCHDADPEGLGSLELFKDLQKKVKKAEIVIQSGLADIPVMRRCLQLGAKKYLLKDHMADELVLLIESSLESRHQREALNQLILGVDRNNPAFSKEFNENDLSIRRAITDVIQKAHKMGKTVGFCGQRPSDDPDFIAFLVNAEIDTISFNADALIRGINNIDHAER